MPGANADHAAPTDAITITARRTATVRRTAVRRRMRITALFCDRGRYGGRLGKDRIYRWDDAGWCRSFHRICSQIPTLSPEKTRVIPPEQKFRNPVASSTVFGLRNVKTVFRAVAQSSRWQQSPNQQQPHSVGEPERFVDFPPIQRGPQISEPQKSRTAFCDSLWSF